MFHFIWKPFNLRIMLSPSKNVKGTQLTDRLSQAVAQRTWVVSGLGKAQRERRKTDVLHLRDVQKRPNAPECSRTEMNALEPLRFLCGVAPAYTLTGPPAKRIQRLDSLEDVRLHP